MWIIDECHAKLLLAQHAQAHPIILLSIYILIDTICFYIPCTCTYRSLCNYIIGFIIDAVTIYTKYISHNAASPINLPPDERQHIEGKRTSTFLRLSEKFLVHVIIGYTKETSACVNVWNVLKGTILKRWIENIF